MNRYVPLFWIAITSFCITSHAALVTAGELVADLRAINLDAASATWTNMDAGGNTVGNFVTKNGANLNVASIGGISKVLFVNSDNNNAVLSALNVPAALLANNSRSVEAWVYPLSSSATSATVGWGTSGNSAQSSFNYNAGGNGLFSGWNLDTGWNGSLAIGGWIHVAYTYDGTTLKGYTNGVLNKSIAFGPMATAPAKLSVGAGRAATADGFKGYIADVRVHTGVLSAADVSNNFSQGIYSTAPTITGLTNTTIVAGNDLVLSPIVAGFPQPVCQWYSNSFSLPGETNAALRINGIQYGHNGTKYSLVATNLAGKTTNSMTISVIVSPAISGLDNQAVSLGSTVNMAPIVSGVPVPTLYWLRDGANVTDGATGNGSTISGASSGSLSLANAQAADSGVYSLIASNSAGVVTNSMMLTVSSTNVAPAINGPSDQTVVRSNNAVFSATISGLPLPGLQWFENGVELPGRTGASLAVSNVQYSQNGYVYSLVASNSAGMATNRASLYVLVPPALSQPPTNQSVVAGTAATFYAVATGVPAVSYQWSRNGVAIANATNAFYTLSNAQGTDNGAVFVVTVMNAVGGVTSSNAALTVVSTMTGALLPTNGAVNIAPDQQLRIVFSSAPKLGAGKLYVRDASDNSVFATIDTSQFQTFSMWSAVITNASSRTVQGQSFNYLPIAVYGNEAWITLNTSNRFAYNRSYYVNCDAGLFRDVSNASFAAITGTNAWRFSTRPSAPTPPGASSGPTNITVGLDGTGDFATLQGASDWVPQNNTLTRTIAVLPGTYREFAVFLQNRNNVKIVGTGNSRKDVQIVYLYPNYNGYNDRGVGVLRLESSDIYVRNLTIDNDVYHTNNGVVYAGPINTVASTGSRLVFDNVLIKGGQDTLYTISGIAYFYKCEIWGSVDYIYGDALAVFDQCNIVEIRDTGGPVTAPSTPYAQPHGIVFLNCTFPRALASDGYPFDVGVGSTTFQRPWRQDGYTAVINCAVGSQMTTKGWSEWSGRETTCRAREMGTTLIGGGSVTPVQRQGAGAYWLNTVDPDYTNATMDPTNALLYGSTGTNNRVAVTVDTNGLTLPAIFGNAYYNLAGWLPTTIPTISAQPTNQMVASGSVASFSVSAFGQPAPSFQWRKDGTSIPGATNGSLTIPNAALADSGAYSVIVSNSAGVVVSSNAVLAVPPQPVSLTPSFANNAITLAWPAGQRGYRLLAQTNPPGTGLTTNWFFVNNSDTTNQVVIPLNPSNNSVFFRLIYP